MTLASGKPIPTTPGFDGAYPLPLAPDGQSVEVSTSGGAIAALVEGEYLATAPVLVDGAASPLQVDQRGNLRSAAYTSARETTAGATTAVASSALEKSHVLLAAPGRVYFVSGYNSDNVDTFLLLFDAAALPANGTAPSRSPLRLPKQSTGYRSWDIGSEFSVGCVVALSSTADTLTLVTSDVGYFDAEVK